MRLLLPVGLLALLSHRAEAQTLTIRSSPVDAAIYRLKPDDGSLIPLGTGIAELKLQDKDPNTVVVRLEGYRDVSQSFVKGTRFKDKNLTIVLTTRVVRITVIPSDAEVLVDGVSRGQGSLELELEAGHAAAVEVRKTGFAPLRKTYRHDKDAELPPTTDRFELTDRLVLVSSQPSGTELWQDGVSIGVDSANVVVPQGTCVTLRAQKTGWIPLESSYCNKEGLAPPPPEERLQLAGRIVNVAAQAEARIFVAGKPAGTGALQVRIAEGSCVQVRVEQEAFLPEAREYCAQARMPPPPLEDLVLLRPDESYTASVPSEDVNLNIAIDVAAPRTEEQAWRQLSSVILNYFDVLENADRETGYLRTAWQIRRYADGAVLIRTRVIVKRTGNDPLRYTVKLSSERNRVPGQSGAADENFVPWQRLLAPYKDLLAELRARLQ